MQIVKINGVTLQKYEHVGNVTAYGFDNIDDDKINDVYLELCEHYNKIDRYFNYSIFNNNVSGYFRCSNNK